MSAIKSKLDSALEKNRADKIKSSWVTGLSRACGLEVAPECFLSLKETVTLKEAALNRIKKGDCHRQFFLKEDFGHTESYLKSVAIGHQALVLFSSVDRYIGAVRLPASVIFSHIQPIWKVVEEDFCVTTSDLQNGICLELNYYDERGDFIKEGVYELSVWGWKR